MTAAQLTTEPFDYLSSGGGTLHNKNGGTGWAGAWATNGLGNQATVVESTGNELRYQPAGATLIDGGVEAVDFNGTSNQPVAYRAISVPQTNTFYVAYLVRVVSGSWTDTDTFGLHLGVNGTTTSTMNFGMRGTNGFIVRTGTGTPPASNTFGAPILINSNYLLVARISKPDGSGTFDRMEVWSNPGLGSSNTPNTTLNLTAGTGLASISHLMFRAAALEAGDTVRADELQVAAAWTDILVPEVVTPTVNSFSLMYPGNAGPVPGFDPLTNGAVVNLATVGTNLNIRVNATPAGDFGSIVLALTGATSTNRTENAEPWALFGDSAGSYLSGTFNQGVHSLSATPYDADNGAGTPGNALAIAFMVTNVPPNAAPVVALTNPAPAQLFYAPATVLLEAEATDSDGSVTNVEFYAGAVKLGEDSSAPYTLLWTNVPAGAWSLSARAQDDAGDFGFSNTNLISVLDTNNSGSVTGELKKWHCVTISFTGPSTSETNAINPFRDYRLNVTFTHPGSAKSYLVPGFFAADGNAANTSADSGNQWQVRFAPDELGTWNYVASFRTGSDVATNTSPTAGAATSFDGASGTFEIAPTDKTGRDFRSKGRLQYVNKHHLQFAGTGEFFLKCGADAPENLLAYDDIDDTPNDQKNQPNLRKSWAPHALDYDAADAAAYTWQGGRGSNLLGAVKYLSEEGMNVFSFLTFNVDGDDDNVFPHRLVTNVAAYEALADNARWAGGVVYHDRFDVSKLEQWDRIFAYGQKRGMYLHFKTQETENDQRMDGGAVGLERQLYYRELIARHGYHLALNWNLGEENTNTEQQRKAMAQYFWDNDPYRHNIVLHTFPGDKNTVYTPLLGAGSQLTGLSLQTSKTNFTEVFPHTKEWVDKSALAGRPWVVACDEPGDASHALVPDSDMADFDPERNNSRKNGLWGQVMAGGAGLEWYFGYNHPHSDLTCQDFRSRDLFWDQCRYMLEFFASNSVPFQDMKNDNSLVASTNTYCLYQSNEVYVVFLKFAETTTLDLASASGSFTVRWYDPRNGGALQTGTVTNVSGGGVVSLGSPPVSSTNDWVALVRAPISPAPPLLSLVGSPGNWQLTWSAPGFELQSAPQVLGPWTSLPLAASPYALSPTNALEFFRLRWTAP